jgi:hypothetical protein
MENTKYSANAPKVKVEVTIVPEPNDPELKERIDAMVNDLYRSVKELL